MRVVEAEPFSGERYWAASSLANTEHSEFYTLPEEKVVRCDCGCVSRPGV